MMKLVHFLMLVAILGIFAFGCGEQPNPVDTNEFPDSEMFSANKISIPVGSTLQSAVFNIYILESSDQDINIHRITSDWDETTVTWNSFGGAFNSTVEGSFNADAVGWKSVDVTPLVQSWLDETYDNYGLLLAQDNMTYPYTQFQSKENFIFLPYLQVCYLFEDETECLADLPSDDSYIWETLPDQNNGLAEILRTGWGPVDEELEKQSLLKFGIDPTIRLAELGDTVWIDNNRDGIQDADEPGFPDVRVELYNCDDEFITSMLTDADGFYIFTSLIPGDYYVKFIQPEGYVFTLQNIGDVATDSNADPATGLDECTNLESGESDMTHDAGLYMRDMEGCSLTIGFWKTHAGFGPQDDVVSQYLPISLGTEGGEKSLNVIDAAMAVDILKMKTYGKPKNGITKLYAQLLGAKLNMAAGADVSVIADAMAEADAFLAENDWEDWNKRDKTALNLMSTFDDYNNGDIGPGHCDDFGDDD